MLKIVIILTILCVSQVNAAFDVDVIRNFLAYKNAKYINVFHCMTKKSELEFIKNMNYTDYIFRLFKMDENLMINKSDVYLMYNKKIGFVLDAMDCEYANSTIHQLSELRAYTLTHPTLVFMTDLSMIEPTFRNVILSVSTDLQVILPAANEYAVYDVYNPSTLHGGELNVTLYRYWQREQNVFARNDTTHLYWIRRNMTGVVFQTMVVLPRGFPGELVEYLHSYENPDVNTFNRFHAVLLYHVRDYYDFHLNMSWTKSWGYKQPNGSFDGMVRAIELRQLDFGTSPLFVKGERLPVLDYGRRSWMFRSAFLFRIPKRPASFEVFLRPLDGQVWYLTVVASVVIVILLKISLRTEILHIKEIVDSTFESSWSHITLFTLGALCQQGAASSPNGISSRISFIFIFIFTVLLYQYYSASIVSILLMTPARIIKDLQDLAFSTLTLGCEDTLYNRDYIHKLENDTVVSRLPKRGPTSDPESFYVEPAVGMPKVAAGGYAFHVELAIAYPIIWETFDEDAVCSLDEIQLFQLQQMHQVLQKGSPFREMIDYGLHRIDEGGLLYRQFKFWHARKPECIRSQPATSAVSIEDFYPALSMLLLGMMMSAFILVVEHIIHFYQIKKEERNVVHDIRNDKQYGMIKRTQLPN